jgi:hypothetical protein|tara:strand:+ start:1831 stop:2361 length:531 start_codon:yes stop_codon:yes gene_type:complete
VKNNAQETLMKYLALLVGLPYAFAALAGPLTTSPPTPTVLFQDRAIPVATTLADPNDLWVATSQLTEINGFELKEEGACLDDICVPIKQSEDSALYVTRRGQGWLSVTELARRLSQAYAVDHDAGVWSFGDIPATRNQFVRQRVAPDFELLDKDGKPVRLSQFKDMKVLLITWASW